MLGQIHSVAGYIEDKSTGERLIGATIYDSLSNNGSTSNSYGYFSLKCYKGKSDLVFSFIGYKTYRVNLFVRSDTILRVLLDQQTYSLNDVLIEDRTNIIENPFMSVSVLPVNTMKKIPALMGETDVLKSLQTLPGVQAGTEGTGGLYIRGGSPDQNLILLDGVPVYNPDHLYGFVSVFNPDAINNVTLYTGGFPSRYGGRLASVVDIRMKDGNNKAFHLNGSIGLLSSKITLEGPLKNDRTSYLFSARRSWADLITRTIFEKKELPYYYFYDFTAKLSHLFSDRSRIFLSIYTGRDHISSIKTKSEFVSDGVKYIFGQDQYYGWGNITSSLRWNYVFNRKIFSNTSLTLSNYKYFDKKQIDNTNIILITGKTTDYKYLSNYKSGVCDIAFRTDFDLQPMQGHIMKYGAGMILHIFTPYARISLLGSDDSSTETDKVKQSAAEPFIYFEDDIQITNRLRVNAGLRTTGFLVDGRTYRSFEPRLSGRFKLADFHALKFSYSRMKQYMHLLTSSRITFPTDLWVPATAKVEPQLSNQYTIGTFFNLSMNIEISIETYFKSMKGLIEYSEGSSFMDPGNWESKIEKNGIGKAYGLELMIKKNSGKTNGWITYSLAKTERKFNDINSGRWFPYKYDRRFDANIVINHKFNEKIDASATWDFSSGNLFTLITDVYDTYLPKGEQWYIQYFEKRNNYRLPAYHRLDLGINFHRQKKSFYRTWNISIYNAYNHRNVFFVYFGNDDLHGKKGQIVLKQYSLFPILPSVTYNLKF
jgi:hypothetical protein